MQFGLFLLSVSHVSHVTVGKPSALKTGSAEANGKFDACANPNPLSEEDLRKQPGSQEGQQWKKTANVS